MGSVTKPTFPGGFVMPNYGYQIPIRVAHLSDGLNRMIRIKEQRIRKG